MAGRLSKVDSKAVPAGSVYDYQVKSRERGPSFFLDCGLRKRTLVLSAGRD